MNKLIMKNLFPLYAFFSFLMIGSIYAMVNSDENKESDSNAVLKISPARQENEQSLSYESLDHLKKEAQKEAGITFVHSLSEFTLNKLNDDTKKFFVEHGVLYKSSSVVAPHVKVYKRTAVDTKSSLGHSRMGAVRLAQDIDTKEFYALKHMLQTQTLMHNMDDLTQINKIDEIKALKQLGRLKGYVKDETKLMYAAIDLVDGVTFNEIYKLNNKVNIHAKLLIAYNLCKEITDVCEKRIIQRDINFGNFMVDVRKFDVRLIDLGTVRFVTPSECLYEVCKPYDFNIVHLTDYIFEVSPRLNSFYVGNLKEYARGTFKDYFTLLIQYGDNMYSGQFLDIKSTLPFSQQEEHRVILNTNGKNDLEDMTKRFLGLNIKNR